MCTLQHRFQFDGGRLSRAGAAEVVDCRDPDLNGRLRALAPDGVDLYVDTSGHLDLPAAVDLLAARGRLVLLAGGSPCRSARCTPTTGAS
jgi:NADPH:quinone reductase-like Zn-dependent oxidoreductase